VEVRKLNRLGQPAIRLQGIFYLATGVWPLLSPGSFQRITGPKSDFWLAQTLGGLISVVGFVLMRSSRPTQAVRQLAIGSAVALAFSDMVFVARRRISPVYLLDATVELALAAAVAAANRNHPAAPGENHQTFPPVADALEARSRDS
jgi:hypothetical protein